MNTAKERLLLYLQYLRLGQTKFEALCGLSRGYINHLNGAISTEKLQKIISACPDLNPMWLATGEGDMLRNHIHQTSHGDHSPNVVGTLTTKPVDSGCDHKLIEALLKSQKQIDRLISVIERLTGGATEEE